MPEEYETLDRRGFFGRLGGSAVSAALAASAACGGKSHRISRPPNLVLINADDLGMGDLSCYGSDIPTPCIDSIGSHGVKFTDFYVSAPVCTPSRFSQLTGLVPARSRHKLTSPLMPTSEKDSERGLEADETTSAQVLKKQGYATGLIGKWHLGHGNRRFLPTSHGFDYFYGFTPGCIDYFTHLYRGEPCFYRNGEMIREQGYSTDLFTGETLSFIQRNRDRPFYLNLAHNAPHYGKADAPGAASNVLQAPDELVAEFNGPDRHRNVYSAMVASMDKGVGEILDTLDRLQLAENTLVVFTSDNGADYDYGGNNDPYRGEKGTLFEGGIRVPCLMFWPGTVPSGAVSSQVGSHLDFFPTFAALAGADISDRTLDGMDLSVAIRNAQGPLFQRTLFWDYSNWLAVRHGNWKYLADQQDESYLFDLAADPYEKENLIEKQRSVSEEMRKKLDNFLSSI